MSGKIHFLLLIYFCVKMQISNGKIKCNWEPTELSTVGRVNHKEPSGPSFQGGSDGTLGK